MNNPAKNRPADVIPAVVDAPVDLHLELSQPAHQIQNSLAWQTIVQSFSRLVANFKDELLHRNRIELNLIDSGTQNGLHFKDRILIRIKTLNPNSRVSAEHRPSQDQSPEIYLSGCNNLQNLPLILTDLPSLADIRIILGHDFQESPDSNLLLSLLLSDFLQFRDFSD